MFLLFAAQIFYIVIKSIYVNLYKAQKKQSIYFIKLTAIIVVGFVFNVICYNLYKVKESFVDESFVRCNGRLGHLGNGERRKTADDRVHRECDPDDAVHRDGDVDV